MSTKPQFGKSPAKKSKYKLKRGRKWYSGNKRFERELRRHEKRANNTPEQ